MEDELWHQLMSAEMLRDDNRRSTPRGASGLRITSRMPDITVLSAGRGVNSNVSISAQ
jgi:hypothetical protein